MTTPATSAYLLRPSRTYLQARAARLIARLIEQRKLNPWPWFDTPHG